MLIQCEISSCEALRDFLTPAVDGKQIAAALEIMVESPEDNMDGAFQFVVAPERDLGKIGIALDIQQAELLRAVLDVAITAARHELAQKENAEQ